nr:GNAT family N-acetyltransferase [uncultured Caproiciproducens sp.]
MPIAYQHELTAEDYNALRKAVEWDEIESDQAQEGLRNSAYMIAAADEGKMVGMARAISDGGYVVLISDVIVHPDYQGQGIAKTMIEDIMTYFTDRLKSGQAILFNLMAAKGRESFYKQFGFSERPNDSVGAGMTQWIKKS